MKKQSVLCLALILAMTTGLAACSGQQEASSPSSSKTPEISLVFAEKEDRNEASKEITPDIDEKGSHDTKDTTPVKGAEGEKELAEGFAGADAYIAGEASPRKRAALSYSDAAVPADRIATPGAPTEATPPTNAEKPSTETDIASLEEPLIIEEPPIVEDPPVDPPQAGQLTAGEWNDNDNWGFFTNLVNAQTITFPSFGIEPRFRTMITVQDASGKAIVNATVRLYGEDGTVLWKAVTDKKGNAYLFTDKDGLAAKVGVESGSKTQEYALEQRETNQQQGGTVSENRAMTVTFDGEGTLYQDMDIMFIVDTTGSMLDEMMFLQSEFTAITEEVGSKNTRYSVNFYRDEGDDYVTRCNDFTTDIKELQTKLNSESADGGGDTPEAVAEILEKTLQQAAWKEDAVKIAFLIFDAPPHEGKEESLRKSIQAAAEKGIRLIPVVSSNSDRETELFGRAIAITTGGSYVFLTDDSGIGDFHLEPIIGDYEVEKLYDVIIRLIGEYRQG